MVESLPQTEAVLDTPLQDSTVLDTATPESAPDTAAPESAPDTTTPESAPDTTTPESAPDTAAPAPKRQRRITTIVRLTEDANASNDAWNQYKLKTIQSMRGGGGNIELFTNQHTVTGFEVNGRRHDFMTASIATGSGHNNKVIWQSPDGQLYKNIQL